jgi:hypothetical protein
MNSNQVYPEIDKAIQLVLRPDGTKAELFYEPISDVKIATRGWETEDGRYVFIEHSKAGQSRVVSVNYNRPYNSDVDLSEKYNGEFYSIFPDTIDQYFVSYREDNEHPVGLYHMLQDSSNLNLIYKNDEYHLIEPVVVRPKRRPKKLPSRIVEDDAMGIILCTDADLSQDSSKSNTRTSNVEIFGIDTSFGKIPVSEDGSFYIKVPSNTPIRFQTSDISGQVKYGHSDWIWVRPNERRGCVGCHENRELTPENKVPLAVNNKPKNILDFPENLDSTKE